MTRLLAFITVVFACLEATASTSLDSLANRLFGSQARHFTFEIIPADTEHYTVTADNGDVHIAASTRSAAAVGLNRYLTEACATDVSWYAFDPVELPDTLPTLAAPLTGESRVPMRFFLNYCTYGYSMPFWKWTDWERLIDWMALHGVNAPLSVAGQEAIWQRVWRSFGLDDDTIRAYFTGPAHLPWHRMLNIDHWEGPLPQSYIDSQEALQKQILTRARELGMTPILPAFAGHVPQALGELLPDVKIHPMSEWGGMDPEAYRSYFIEPNEAIFDTIQQRFLTEQTAVFGTDHIYGIDPFNEIEVPSWDEEYLRNASSRIYATLSAVDPEARWLQMGWMFYFMQSKWTPERIKAFLSGVAPDKMIILDYYCDHKPLWEDLEAFYGTDFIWCYLGNFGGNSYLAGNMDLVNHRLKSAYTAANPNMTGIGGTLEGLDLNRHMHTYVLDCAWNHADGPANPRQWIDIWADTRGARSDSIIARAWSMLYNDIYRGNSLNQPTPINVKPNLDSYRPMASVETQRNAARTLVEVWKMLIDAKSDCNAHLYDIVNVGRQVLGNQFEVIQDSFATAWKRRDVQAMRLAADKMSELIADQDRLMATHQAFSLGKWTSDARDYGTDPAESDFYESNARRIISTWGRNSLNDYANRDLAGMATTFYGQRWRMFTDTLIKRAENGEDFKGADDPFYTDMADMEWNWAFRHDNLPLCSGENPKSVAAALYDKYFGNSGHSVDH